MFAYCNNNPVNNIDSSGLLTISIMVAKFSLGAIASGIGALWSGGTGWDVCTAMIAGGISSLLTIDNKVMSIAVNTGLGMLADYASGNIRDGETFGESLLQNAANSVASEFLPLPKNSATESTFYSKGQPVLEFDEAVHGSLKSIYLSPATIPLGNYIKEIVTPAKPRTQLSWFMHDIQSAYDNQIGKIYAPSSGSYRWL